MPSSGTVTAGSAALASQYNNLRADVLNTSTGHTHTGASEDGAKVAATGVSSGTAANGAVLTADGSGAAAFLAAGAAGGILKYEEFTSSGSFVIPSNASSSAAIVLEIVSGGVGGRGGANRGSGTAASGGQGGPGGNYGFYTDLVSSFGTASGTVTVTVGAGGAGGTGTSATGGFGGVGTDGGASSFGTVSIPGNQENNTLTNDFSGELMFGKAAFYAYATNNTPSGTVTAPTIVAGAFIQTGGGYGYSSPPDYVSGIDNGVGGGGGGGGGGLTTANAIVRSGNGGKRYSTKNQHIRLEADGDGAYTFGNGAVGGTAAGSAGAAGSSGDGGAGGNSNTGGNGGVGGAGGQPGGGGGGGGACRTGSTSGAGGAGGAGRVRVWVIG